MWVCILSKNSHRKNDRQTSVNIQLGQCWRQTCLSPHLLNQPFSVHTVDFCNVPNMFRSSSENLAIFTEFTHKRTRFGEYVQMVRSVDKELQAPTPNCSNWGFRDRNCANMSSVKSLILSNRTETKRDMCWIYHNPPNISIRFHPFISSDFSCAHRLKFRATTACITSSCKVRNCVCSKSMSKLHMASRFHDFPAKLAINLNSLSYCHHVPDSM